MQENGNDVLLVITEANPVRWVTGVIPDVLDASRCVDPGESKYLKLMVNRHPDEFNPSTDWVESNGIRELNI
jgi:hypothetical protein